MPYLNLTMWTILLQIRRLNRQQILGSDTHSLNVWEFNFRKWTQSVQVLSFFCTYTKGEDHELVDSSNDPWFFNFSISASKRKELAHWLFNRGLVVQIDARFTYIRALCRLVGVSKGFLIIYKETLKFVCLVRWQVFATFAKGFTQKSGKLSWSISQSLITHRHISVRRGFPHTLHCCQ